ERARQGDGEALNDLFTRQLTVLRQWASGRMPRWVRDANDTQDLVQDTALHTFRRLGAFEPERARSLQAYLRTAVKNRIRNEFRRARRAAAGETLDAGAIGASTSPLEAVIRGEQRHRYESALQRLLDHERQLLVGRLELGLSYDELAEALGKSSPDAARKAAARALLRLTDELRRDAI